MLKSVLNLFTIFVFKRKIYHEILCRIPSIYTAELPSFESYLFIKNAICYMHCKLKFPFHDYIDTSSDGSRTLVSLARIIYRLGSSRGAGELSVISYSRKNS